VTVTPGVLHICIGFVLGIYLWPSLENVLEVLIHPSYASPFPTSTPANKATSSFVLIFERGCLLGLRGILLLVLVFIIM
jgi:hypothetical protein